MMADSLHSRAAVALAALLLAVLLMPSYCAASALYRYTDDSGEVHVTDSGANVPDEFKDSIEVVDEKDIEDGGLRFPKTLQELKDEQKWVNKALELLKQHTEGRELVIIGVALAAVILMLVVLKILRGLLKIVAVILLLAGLVAAFMYIYRAGKGDGAELPSGRPAAVRHIGG